MAERADFQRARDQFADWRWRLNNLYWITDKEGRRAKFEMNWAQVQLFDTMHYMNAILKARQLGFTTFIQIFMLDAAVFNSNVSSGTIAHTLDDAQRIFRDKVKYPYDNLPAGIRSAVRSIASNKTEIELSNNSRIRVGTSLRSGTLQYLHISEYGKLCAKYPEKAREVRTGALNTVQSGQIVFIESTAEGQEGHFHDLCEEARSKGRMNAHLTPLDFKFHFYPWWQEPGYSIDPAGVTVTDEMAEYFGKLEDLGIELSAGQKAWYVKKAETQLSDMKREYPSTPDEAFEASVEGAYYAEQMARVELEQRLGDFSHVEGYPVHTISDIGMDDANSVWMFQVLPERIRMLAYFEHTGTGMDGMIAELVERRDLHGYVYGTHYMPHDVKVREWTRGGLTRIEIMLAEVQAKSLGTVEKVERAYVEDRIQGSRRILAKVEFDEAGTSQGVKCLRNYRKEWDEERGVWKDRPRHDWASHGADAFGGLPVIFTGLAAEPLPERKPKTIHEATLDDLWDEYGEQYEAGRI